MTKRFGDRQRLEHMLTAINDVRSFTWEATLADFERNRMMQFACVRGFEIIGEAANHVSSALRDANSHIAWRDIIGMRNFAVHQYFDVQPTVMLKTAQQDLPVLKQQLEQVLQALSA